MRPHGKRKIPEIERVKHAMDPQTNRLLQVLRSDRELARLAASRRARWWGQKGEEFLQSMHPHWSKMPHSNKGYDFVNKLKLIRGQPEKIEVKTITPEESLAGKIFLKLRLGDWHNHDANTLWVVSFGGIYRANADRLRLHIKNVLNHPSYDLVKRVSERQFISLEFDLNHLVQLGVLTKQNVSERHFHGFVKGEMAKLGGKGKGDVTRLHMRHPDL